MSAEQYKALVRRFFEAQEDVNRHKADLDALDKMLAPTSSATLNCFPANSPAAKATSRLSPSFLPLLPTPGSTSRTR